MALVTEATVREQCGDPVLPTLTRYEVAAGTVVSPSARAWLIDRHIDLVIGDKVIFAHPRTEGRSVETTPAAQEVSALPAFTAPEHFDVIDGSQVETKPEHLTALRGNLLVAKNHPQIKFRGRLDSLEADIVWTQVQFRTLGLEQAVADLGEVLNDVRQILRSEVLDVPFEQVTLLGLDDEQLRYRSHYPKTFYAMTHFAATVDDGEGVVLLNRLRTQVREVELAAYDAFAVSEAEPPTRLDLIKALNRLSSAVYLMMFKAKTGDYQ